MSGEEHRCLFSRSQKYIQDLMPSQRIQGGCRFVTDQQPRPPDQGLSDSQPLLHPPGITPDLSFLLRQTHQGQQFFDAASQFLPRKSRDLAAKLQVFLSPHIGIKFRHVRKISHEPVCSRLSVGYRLPADQDAPAVRRKQAQYGLHGRGLAGSVSPDKSEDASFTHRETDALQDLFIAKAFFYVVDR